MVHHHRIPDNLAPDGSICVTLYLPNDSQWLSFFVAHIRKLANDRQWQRDEAKSALLVREIWMNVTIKPLIDALINGEYCGMTEIDCEAIEACLQDSETILDLDARIAELEANMATQEEICAAIQCALEDAAKRYLLGQSQNFVQGLELDTEKGLQLVESGKESYDPPTTATDLEVRNGKSYGVGLGFRGLILSLNDWILNGFTNEQIAEFLTLGYKTLYSATEVETLTAINEFRLYASDVVTPSPSADDISKFIWLFGLAKTSMWKWAIAVQNSSGSDAEDIGFSYRQIISLLQEQQLEEWYRNGGKQPRTDYLTYPDYRVDDSNIFTITPAMLFTGVTLKRFVSCFDSIIGKDAPNRWALKCTGVITNTVSGLRLDCQYEETAEDVFAANILSFCKNDTTSSISSEQVPPHKASGEYLVYFTQTIDDDRPTGVTFNNLPVWDDADCTGELTVQRIDLGALETSWLGLIS